VGKAWATGSLRVSCPPQKGDSYKDEGGKKKPLGSTPGAKRKKTLLNLGKSDDDGGPFFIIGAALDPEEY